MTPQPPQPFSAPQTPPRKSLLLEIRETEDELSAFLLSKLTIEDYNQAVDLTDKILALNLLAITLENSSVNK